MIDIILQFINFDPIVVTSDKKLYQILYDIKYTGVLQYIGLINFDFLMNYINYYSYNIIELNGYKFYVNKEIKSDRDYFIVCNGAYGYTQYFISSFFSKKYNVIIVDPQYIYDIDIEEGNHYYNPAVFEVLKYIIVNNKNIKINFYGVSTGGCTVMYTLNNLEKYLEKVYSDQIKKNIGFVILSQSWMNTWEEILRYDSTIIDYISNFFTKRQIPKKMYEKVKNKYTEIDITRALFIDNKNYVKCYDDYINKGDTFKNMISVASSIKNAKILFLHSYKDIGPLFVIPDIILKKNISYNSNITFYIAPKFITHTGIPKNTLLKIIEEYIKF